MTKSWKLELKQLITQPEVLWRLLDLPVEYLPAAKTAVLTFPLRVSAALVARMQKGNVHDPLLKQVLPWHLELVPQPENFSMDPLQEQKANKLPGLLHKYYGRVLLVLGGACAVNCRYCFRRHFPYEDNNPGTLGLNKILDYIHSDSSITEVILSGGDPLMLADLSLAKLVQALNEVPHLHTLRIHSRIPIVLPARIDEAFIELMRKSRLHKVMVTHVNHAQELDLSVQQALARLRSADFHLLNQAVLLRGINDSVSALIELSKKLFAFGVLPYYLHLLDPVHGSAHFEVPLLEAQRLMWQLMQKLPGYLVPKLASEVPGLGCKWVHSINKGQFLTLP